MENIDPITVLLRDVSVGDKPNHLYLVIDGSANVTDKQFDLAKKASCALLKNFQYSNQAPFSTTVTVVQSGSANSVHCNKGTSLQVITNAIKNTAQVKNGPNVYLSLQYIKTQAASVQGNKVVFVFTDGVINAKPLIDQMIQERYHIRCFLITEKVDFDINPVCEIFGFSRVVLFKSCVDIENFFDKVFIANSGVPQISTKSSSTKEITLNITSSVPYDEYEIHGYPSGADISSILGTTKTNKIVLRNLVPSKKYYLKVRGKRGSSNTFSQFSKEESVKTLSESNLQLKLQNKERCEQEVTRLRNKIRAYRIPPSLVKAGIKIFNICLFSEIGNGKSSLVNTIISALLDAGLDPCQLAGAGASSQIFTRKLHKILIYGIAPIKLLDIFGWQVDKVYSQLTALTQGKLREGYEEGSSQDMANHFLEAEADPNNAPHAYLTLSDIYSAQNVDKINKFKEFYKSFKQLINVPTFVAMTKFDKLLDGEGDPLLQNGIERIYDHSQVRDEMEGFAKKAEISLSDIFLILNYEGANEVRSDVKDLLALHLLDKIITGIENHFKTFKIVNIVNQSNKIISTILLPNLDITLEMFEKNHRGKLEVEGFRPIGFYDKYGKLIHGQDYGKITLNKMVSDETLEDDGYTSYILKAESANKEINTIPASCQQAPPKIIEKFNVKKRVLRIFEKN